MKNYSALTDRERLAEVARLAQHERQSTAELIASLVEVDSRRLYLGEGCSSLFTYCTQFLRLSEGAAYGRIQAARAAARFPVILDLLVDGLLNLTTVGLLAPHLTVENHRAVLDAARGQSKRAVEEQAAALRPRPDVPTSSGNSRPRNLARRSQFRRRVTRRKQPAASRRPCLLFVRRSSHRSRRSDSRSP
jgi:hypothetical protein